MAISVPGGGGVGSDDDPVMQRLNSELDAEDSQLKGTLYNSVGTNPDAYAKTKQVATQLGYPTAAVEAQPGLATDAQIDTVVQHTSAAPVLKSKLAVDDDFAKLAHDDTGNLSLTERAMSALKSSPSVDYLERSAISGLYSLGGAATKLVQTLPMFTSPEEAATLFKGDTKGFQDFMDNSPAMFLHRLSTTMTQGANLISGDLDPTTQKEFGDLKYQTTDPNKAAYLHPVKVIGDALQSLPTSIATGVTIYLTRGAASSAEAEALAAGLAPEAAHAAGIAAAAKTASLVGASSEGAVGYAQQALQTEQDSLNITDENLHSSPEYQKLLKNGYTPETAKAKLIGDASEQSGQIAGIVDAAVNAVGGHFLGKVIGEGGGIVKGAAKAAATEGATEFVQSGGEQAGENLAIKSNLDPTQNLGQGVLENAIQGLVVGGFTGGAMTGIHGVAAHYEQQTHNAQLAMQNKDALTQLDAIASQGLLRTRDQSAFHDYVTDVASHTPVNDVYIDAAALAQSGVAEQLAQASPAVAEQMQQALDTGGSVRIPLEDYMTHIAGTELSQPIIDHLKLDPNGMSFAESQTFQQTHQEEFTKAVDQVIEAQGKDDAFKASTSEVKTAIQEQLKATGRQSEAVADINSTLASAYFAVRAAQLGITPKELYDRNPLNVLGQSVTGATLEQGRGGNVGEMGMLRSLHRKAQDIYDYSFKPDEAFDALHDVATPDERSVLFALKSDNLLGYSYPHEAVAAMMSAPEAHNPSPQLNAAVAKAGDAYFKQVTSSKTRGAYSPSANTIVLLKNADLSTFLHELGHAFLAMDSTFASELTQKAETSEGEKQILADQKTIFDWFGFKGELPEQLGTWHGMNTDAQREFHEKFAEGFEAYLFTGKAPNLELQGAFQRIRAWFINVYRSMSQYLSSANETLTPEVRGVFDRMLASTTEIQRAEQARSMTAMTAIDLDMTPEQFASYHQDTVEASADAIDDLEAKSLRDMTWTSRLKERTVKEFNKMATGIRKDVRSDVTKEVDAMPVYAAMRFLKHGETIDPKTGQHVKVEVGNKLSITGLQELYPPKELAAHPDWEKLGYGKYGMLSDKGLQPDMVAGIFGFQSGDEMVRALLDAHPRNQVIEGMTDQRMLEQHGELSTPEAISLAADEAIHNGVRTRVLATELAGMQRALGSAQVLARMAKDYAQHLVGNTVIKDLRPAKYASDAARASKAADTAMRKGDRQEAVNQKRNQLVNHASTREAYQAQAEVKTILQSFRKMVTAKTDTLSKTRNMDLVNTVRAVLGQYGVGARGQDVQKYMELIKQHDPVLYDALEPTMLQAQRGGKNIQDMTVDELRGLRDQVDSLWYLSRREKQAEIDGKLVDREKITAELSDRLDVLGVPTRVPGEGSAVTDKERKSRMLQGARAALRRVEHWVHRMDGSKAGVSGVFRSYIFTPVSEAADKYREDSVKYVRTFRDLLKKIEPTLSQGRIAAPEIGYTFGHSTGDAGMSELLHAVLHTGNESNKRKLLLGRGWGTENTDGTLNTEKWDAFIKRMMVEGRLTKEHYAFAQAVWDMLESTKANAQKTHRDVFGRYFDEVTATPFTNQFGSFRGGYMPAIADTFEVQDASINAALEDVNASNSYMFPTTSKGFTKSRVEYNKPLALDLRLIPQHLDKVLMFSHMESPVRDVQRTLKSVQGKLNRYDPVAYTDMLLPWLNRSAKQIVQTPATGWGGKMMDRVFSTARSRAGMTTMFANLTNAVQQLTGLTLSAVRVDGTHLRQSVAQFIKSPGEMSDGIAALSKVMNHRLNHEVFQLRNEIEDMLINPSKYDQVKAWTQKHAYFLQAMFQNTVDVITWHAAYNAALEKDDNQKLAIRTADSAVRETQGSLEPEDISRFETGTSFQRLFTQFASYYNMQANLMGSDFATTMHEQGFKQGRGRLLYTFAMAFLIPAYISEAIVRGMQGGGGDGDDEYLDEWLSFFFGTPLRSGAAMVPGVGQIGIRIAGGFTPQTYDDRIATSPAISALESAGRAPASIYNALAKDGSEKMAVKDTLSLIAMLTGMPVTVVGKPLGYAADVHQGKVKPTGAVDAVRGSISGVASASSKQ